MRRVAATVVLVLGPLSLVVAADETESGIDFARDVRPILAANCFACHGPDAAARKGDLRLDLKADALRDRDGSFAILPGKPDESTLVERITETDPSLRMPPPASEKMLTPRQIQTLKTWVAKGAEWKEHWAWTPPRKTDVPDVDEPGFVRNDIDRYILKTLSERQFPHSPEADPVTLVRRLSFDLTGLPPTPEAVRQFVQDTSPNAYEQLVDRLLSSPHYGERLALYWLDVVRYADTVGIHSDVHRNIDLYRDYVIRAFIANKPFDQFVVEQIAGDLLPEPTDEQRIASAYNRLSMTTEEGGAQPKEYLAKYSADRVRNTATAFLGVTLGCAECHDHKYDPFLARDFYRFAAFFADVKETPVGKQDEVPFPTSEEEAQLKSLQAEAAGHPAGSDERKAIQARIDALKKTFRRSLITVSMTPRTMRVLPRGNWLDETGEVVQPGVPLFLRQTAETSTRVDLAKWLVAPDNPLVARVFVNRMWKLVFGRGLVRSLDDFGMQGAPPTHPELLDWLAVDFQEHGWDVKRLMKQLVTSGTYRQSSHPAAELRQADSENQWLARQSHWRLEAELIRDNALAVSGMLVPKLYGRSVRPWQPPGFWRYLNFPEREYEVDTGENLYRRGLYTYWCRTFPHPSLTAFDAPSREESCVERPRSSTPLQALVLLNDPIYVEAARGFAERLLALPDLDDSSRITRAFELAVSRPPRADELSTLTDLLARHRAKYTSDTKARDALLKVGSRPVPKDADRSELAAWTSVARVILNLHEAITRY